MNAIGVMKRQQDKMETAVRNSKIKAMNRKKEKWMAERSAAKTSSVCITDKERAEASKQTRLDSGKAGKRTSANEAVMRWSSKGHGNLANEFIIRKASGTSISLARSLRQSTSRSDNNSAYNTAPAVEEQAQPNKAQQKHMKKPAAAENTTAVDDDSFESFEDETSSTLSRLMDSNASMQDFKTLKSGRQYSPRNYYSSDNEHAGEEVDSGYYKSHCCPVCKKIMNTDKTTATLVIPCGHSVCRCCIAGQMSCPLCHARLQSSVVNTSLQQIILSHKATLEQEKRRRDEEFVIKYKHEYDSLTMRSDVLQDEAKDIVTEMRQITDQIMDTKQHMESTHIMANATKEKIKELKMELQEHESTYTEHNKKSKSLENQYEKSKEKLAMIEETLSKIQQGKEKVKYIVTDICPNFKTDKW